VQCKPEGSACDKQDCCAPAVCFEDKCITCAQLGQPCPNNWCCESWVCIEGKCLDCAVTGESCPDKPCCPGWTCKGGKCEEGGGNKCNCKTNGAQVVPVSGCESWPDADKCSGWASAVIESQGWEWSPQAEADAQEFAVESGTQFCAFGCCIKLVCP